MDNSALAEEAIAARDAAYVPYSGFKVGAALLTKGGKVYRGCNIENAAYSPSNCAERTAFFAAVAAGEREFAAIAVAGWKDAKPEGFAQSFAQGFAFPCGVCRQVMMEFCEPDNFTVIVTDPAGNLKVHSLKELLPEGFGPANLGKT